MTNDFLPSGDEKEALILSLKLASGDGSIVGAGTLIEKFHADSRQCLSREPRVGLANETR